MHSYSTCIICMLITFFLSYFVSHDTVEFDSGNVNWDTMKNSRYGLRVSHREGERKGGIYTLSGDILYPKISSRYPCVTVHVH